MTRIEPDIVDSLLPEDGFYRSTVLRAIDDLRGEWNPELSDDPDEEAYLHGGDQALQNFRARFQPTEGENDG